MSEQTKHGVDLGAVGYTWTCCRHQVHRR